jgi:hypothetical protein
MEPVVAVVETTGEGTLEQRSRLWSIGLWEPLLPRLLDAPHDRHRLPWEDRRQLFWPLEHHNGNDNPKKQFVNERNYFVYFVSVNGRTNVVVLDF